MKRLLLFFGLLFSGVLTAQLSHQSWLSAINGSLRSGFGAGEYGIGISGVHIWNDSARFETYTGVEIQSFWGSEKTEVSAYATSGFVADFHAHAIAGGTLSLLPNRSLALKVEGYVGGYHLVTKGKLTSASQGIDRPYHSAQQLFDFGARLGVGYRLSSKWTVGVDVQNSFRQINSGLGPTAGLFAGEPDGKFSIGIGVNFRL